MADLPPPISPSRTTCASLLKHLQIIWDEIGESDGDRDTMLLQLEQECLDIYRRKVEETRKYKADLFQSLIEAEAEITNILSSLGECASFSRGKGTLKEQMAMVRPFLEDLRSRKEHRIQEFSKIMTQISQISAEIAGYRPVDGGKEQEINDLTVRKLEQLKSHLQELQNEKVLRLQKVYSYISTIHDLSAVMSIDFLKTFNRIHPSLCDSSEGSLKSISNDTLARLTEVIHSLKQDKKQRLQKLQDLARSLIELWDLMEIPIDERKDFNHVTSLIPLSVDEVSKQGCLSVEVIEQAELEVERLEILKVSKLKDLVFKRQNELEEIYRGVHMDVDSDKAKHILTGLIESGSISLSDLLQSMDDQIIKAKEEAFSRKDILDKVEKWHLAAEEENWLDEYERDENRYSAVRGAHKNLKRAEKARILVSKIPSIIENLNAKIKAWEKEKGIPFLYDKVPLLQSLNDFNLLRKQREEEKRKSRELRRQQEQVVEQEGLFIPKSATKKTLGQNTNSNVTGTPIGRRILTPSTRYASLSGKERRESSRVNKVAPVNYVALQKDDSISGNN